MNRYTFCMALLMTFAEYWQRMKRTYQDFYNYYWWWFTESDGLTADDVLWCWQHPNIWITEDTIEKLPDYCFH